MLHCRTFSIFIVKILQSLRGVDTNLNQSEGKLHFLQEKHDIKVSIHAFFCFQCILSRDHIIVGVLAQVRGLL